ncbi:MAG: AAA family ATPase [Tepidisphaeraceae bacterium]|jgi:predicted ATPase
MLRWIVLTGGPGSGKTVVSAALVGQDPARYALVPEAATQVYAALRTRWDRLDVAGRRKVQRRIYRLQVEQEARVARENPGKALLLDRGTIDGSAYWPDGPEDYWRDLGTTVEREIARYDAVIWLGCSAAIGRYDGDNSNFCRFEDAGQAVRNGELLRRLWEGHPRLRTVAATRDVAEKVRRVREILETVVD